MKIFKSDAFKVSVIYFLVTRIVLILISYCVINEFGLYGIRKTSTCTFYENALLNTWGNFDSGWYLTISNEWYPVLDKTTSDSAFQRYSFFPLYPGFIRLIHFLTGLNNFIIGLVISNICLLISGWLLYKMTEIIYNKEIAKWSVIFLYLFPVSFIFSGMFTEALSLLVLILGCFYFILQRKWIIAGVAAFFLVLCRPLGIFILVPFAYKYFKSPGFILKKTRIDIISLTAIPAAVLVLMLNNAFSSSEKFSLSRFYGSGYKIQFQNPLLNLYTWITSDYFTQSFLGLFTLSIIIFWILFYKHLSISMHIVMFYSIFVPMCYTLMSAPRMMLAAFPLFILLASVSVKYKAQNIFVIALTLLQGYLFVCWCLGFGNVI